MSLERWKTNGWLREYKTTVQEVSSILDLVERELNDAAKKEISTDWQFNIAYNAGLQVATAGTISKKEVEDLLQTVREF